MQQRNSVVILAAGRSQRMGRPKSLLPINGFTLLEFQIESCIKMNLTPIVVLGFHQTEIRKAISDLDDKAMIIVNPDPERGQFSSIRMGLSSIKNGSAYVLPVDTPAPKPEVWRLIQEHTNNHWVVIPKFEGKGGHPVLLSKNFVDFLTLSRFEENEQRLDFQIHRLPQYLVKTISVDEPSILVDLDTPADLKKYSDC